MKNFREVVMNALSINEDRIQAAFDAMWKHRDDEVNSKFWYDQMVSYQNREAAIISRYEIGKDNVIYVDFINKRRKAA